MVLDKARRSLVKVIREGYGQLVAAVLLGGTRNQGAGKEVYTLIADNTMARQAKSLTLCCQLPIDPECSLLPRDLATEGLLLLVSHRPCSTGPWRLRSGPDTSTWAHYAQIALFIALIKTLS